MITINLLPRKKPFFTPSRTVLSAIGLAWLAGAVYLALQYFSVEEKIALLEQEIKMKETALSTLQKQTGAEQDQELVERYLLLSERMQHLFLPTTLLMDELAGKLPAQGKLNHVRYNLSGNIQLEGSFEQYDDIAAYLHHLQASPYVQKAEVKQIKTAEITWQGPVDEQGKPISLALDQTSSRLLPRYVATFEIKAYTVDLQQLSASDPLPAAPAEKDDEPSGEE